MKYMQQTNVVWKFYKNEILFIIMMITLVLVGQI